MTLRRCLPNVVETVFSRVRLLGSVSYRDGIETHLYLFRILSLSQGRPVMVHDDTKRRKLTKIWGAKFCENASIAKAPESARNET